MLMKKYKLSEAKKVIIKLGSGIITNDGKGLDEICLQNIVKQICKFNKDMQVVIVSSGAIAAGLKRLEIKQRPKQLCELQAAAAVGQMDLIQIYQKLFSNEGELSAQILLTHNDLSDRERYLNARSTLNNLLEKNVIPVINENDSIANEEIKFGDNDNLAALTANLIEADFLILLTDQVGLFSDDPRTNKESVLIDHAFADDERLDLLAHDTLSSVGSGGMKTKILAARRAALSGTHTIIANGKEKDILDKLIKNDVPHTFLESPSTKLLARKNWLAGQLKAKGIVYVDQGAADAIVKTGKSLLSIGVERVSGEFDRGALVECHNSRGEVIAKGLVNYSSKELVKIMGHSSDKIEQLIGYINEKSLIHRNNLVVFKRDNK